MKYTYDIEEIEKVAFGKKKQGIFNLRGSKKPFNIKKTFYGTPAGKMLTGAAIFLMSSAIGKFVDDMFEYFEERSELKKKPEYYKKMLESHPELLDANPDEVSKLWSSLYHHSPVMAQDPIASGAFIRQSLARGFMEEYGGPSPDTYKTLTGIRKDVADAKDKASSSKFKDAGGKVSKGLGHSMFANYADLLGEDYKMKDNLYYSD